MMIPCMDNAPYHHNRGMPSLSSMKTKKELYELMTKGAGAFPGLPEGATLTLPVVEGKRPTALTVPVTEEMLGTAHKSKPKIPSVEEMKLSFLEAVRADDNLKHHLNCKLEEFIADHNTRINPDMQLCTEENATANHLGWGSFMLWTPPYCPALQPIEEFWGAGKNFAAAHYENDRTMRECIGQLQDGWYGNPDRKDKYGKPKAAVKCGSLVRRVPSAGQQCMLRQAARSVTYTVSHLVYASSAADSILIAGDSWYTDSKGDTWWLTRWKIEVEVPTPGVGMIH